MMLEWDMGFHVSSNFFVIFHRKMSTNELRCMHNNQFEDGSRGAALPAACARFSGAQSAPFVAAALITEEVPVQASANGTRPRKLCPEKIDFFVLACNHSHTNRTDMVCNLEEPSSIAQIEVNRDGMHVQVISCL